MDEDIIGDGCVSGRQKWMRVKNGRSCYFFFHLYDKTQSNVIWSASVTRAPPRATLIKRLFSFYSCLDLVCFFLRIGRRCILQYLEDS